MVIKDGLVFILNFILLVKFNMESVVLDFQTSFNLHLYFCIS